MAGVAPAIVHDVLRSAGRPLDAATRAFMEPRFGHDFSRVQVHADARAAESARAVNSLAYTVGSHVVFGAGQYAPATDSGKRLLAHELTHTKQQGSPASLVQRLCDPAALASRTSPVYFPNEDTIVGVFRGTRTITQSLTPRVSVGLIQQALVDLGYDIGTFGPNHDGVDRKFGPYTAAGVTTFQTAESITGATAGVVDQPTLKCLDDKRSQLAVPPHQAATTTPADVQVSGRERGGRDEDIYFERGRSDLNAAGRTKIGRLLTRSQHPLRGCQITLEGFVSEDELVEFGAGLATDRINEVSAEFARQGHNDPGPECAHPVLPLCTPSPLPAASSGVSAYRSRRKVEVVPSGAASTTAPCPPGSPQFRPLTSTESGVLRDAIDQGVAWMGTAIAELTPGDPEGDAALTAYFGGTGRRNTIRTNLTTWRNHLDTVVRTNNRHGTQCNATCRTATAYNQGTGSGAQVTICPPFFQDMQMHPPLDQDEKKGFVIMHEAGHGSIATRDTGYGHRRLIEFLADYPALAENNTDSYTLMVLCLNNFAAYCAAPTTTDHPVGLSGTQGANARRGLAWLQSWLIWTEQDTSSMYGRMNTARESGQGLRAVSPYYADVYGALVAAFNVHRPPGDPPPTFQEQTLAAAILDRLLIMERATAAGLTVERDATAALPHWASGPGRHVFLTDAYFVLTTDRGRVEFLLPVIIRATPTISVALRTAYETYIKENVRISRGNNPS